MRLNQPLLIAVLIASLTAVPFAAAQQGPEEKVIVTANAYPVPFENLSRAVTVLTRDDIANLPARSIADVLALAASVDMRPRAPFGVQADLSIRGSAFSQVLVLVDGVRINDSQTAHHNSDFPVQLQNVERIEVLLGPGSSIYGADAFGGIINIITRRDIERMRVSVTAGQNDFLEGAFSTGFQKGDVEQTFSFTGSRSSGFEYDRDFRDIALSSQTNLGPNSRLFVSHVNKEFGANGFYGPSPSREWTDQTLASFDRSYSARSGGKGLIQGYYRTHGDRFLYDTRSPGLFESRHRTHSAGVLGKAQYGLTGAGSVTLGGEVGGEWITSNALGDHSFARTSLFTEFKWMLGRSAVIYPGFRFDYYSNFGAAGSPSISGSWWVLPRLRVRSSAGRGFRIPSFTELYYQDPNHQASSSLKPESAWSAETGADFIPAANWLISMTIFSRREQNVIDWIRSSANEKWRTANIRKLRTSGAEIGLERSFGSRAGITARYSRLSTSAGAIDYTSKYVLDYARDSWSASTYFPVPLSLVYRQSLSYKRRADGRDYVVLDGGLEHRFPKFTAAIEFSNLLNSRYQEVAGINMPGRWIVLTLRTR